MSKTTLNLKHFLTLDTSGKDSITLKGSREDLVVTLDFSNKTCSVEVWSDEEDDMTTYEVKLSWNYDGKGDVYLLKLLIDLIESFKVQKDIEISLV